MDINRDRFYREAFPWLYKQSPTGRGAKFWLDETTSIGPGAWDKITTMDLPKLEARVIAMHPALGLGYGSSDATDALQYAAYVDKMRRYGRSYSLGAEGFKVYSECPNMYKEYPQGRGTRRMEKAMNEINEQLRGLAPYPLKLALNDVFHIVEPNLRDYIVDRTKELIEERRRNRRSPGPDTLIGQVKAAGFSPFQFSSRAEAQKAVEGVQAAASMPPGMAHNVKYERAKAQAASLQIELAKLKNAMSEEITRLHQERIKLKQENAMLEGYNSELNEDLEGARKEAQSSNTEQAKLRSMLKSADRELDRISGLLEKTKEARRNERDAHNECKRRCEELAKLATGRQNYLNGWDYGQLADAYHNVYAEAKKAQQELANAYRMVDQADKDRAKWKEKYEGMEKERNTWKGNAQHMRDNHLTMVERLKLARVELNRAIHGTAQS